MSSKKNKNQKKQRDTARKLIETLKDGITITLPNDTNNNTKDFEWNIIWPNNIENGKEML